MGRIVNSLRDVKVKGLKLRGKKSSHVMGWCGLGRVGSLGDFYGLDVPGSQFIKPQVKLDVISGELRSLDKKKKVG